jgi:anthranilate synthase component 2
MKDYSDRYVILIDNYDSFTYNLEQYLGTLGARTETIRNDAATVEALAAKKPDAIVISPGPGIPANAGVSKNVIKKFHGSIPLLGVCLGHQAIGEVFGGKVVQAPEIRHGKISEIIHQEEGIFVGMNRPFTATRYHSLIVDKQNLPESLRVTATSEDGLIMGLQVSGSHTYGLQFHPESYATETGLKLMENFLCCQN